MDLGRKRAVPNWRVHCEATKGISLRWLGASYLPQIVKVKSHVCVVYQRYLVLSCKLKVHWMVPHNRTRSDSLP